MFCVRHNPTLSVEKAHKAHAHTCAQEMFIECVMKYNERSIDCTRITLFERIYINIPCDLAMS